MRSTLLLLPVLAGAAVLACHPATAQTEPQEFTQATVYRDAPAQAPFSASITNRLRVPAGFAVQLFASGLKNPRMMDVGPDGTVYVTRRDQGDVLALRDADGDGRAEDVRIFASNLSGVHGVAVHGADLYLANSTTIWRTPLAGPAAPVVLVSGLPDGGQHPNRMVRFAPDGSMLVSVGSSCNDCAEDNQLERGTVIRYSADGRQREVLAKGLRNTIGYDWHPLTGALWGMDHGADFRGDKIPPEELNQIKPGLNYGWPICYGQRTVDKMTNAEPERLALRPGESRPSGQPITREAYCAQTEPATLLLPAHSAPMAMRFYTGSLFPAAYRNDAFVALRGSWNRGDPVGYKVVRIHFTADGRPATVDDFLTGFLNNAGPTGPEIFGRPVGIALLPDGALLVSDDTNGAIYRVSRVAVPG